MSATPRVQTALCHEGTILKDLRKLVKYSVGYFSAVCTGRPACNQKHFVVLVRTVVAVLQLGGCLHHILLSGSGMLKYGS